MSGEEESLKCSIPLALPLSLYIPNADQRVMRNMYLAAEN